MRSDSHVLILDILDEQAICRLLPSSGKGGVLILRGLAAFVTKARRTHKMLTLPNYPGGVREWQVSELAADTTGLGSSSSFSSS